MKTLLSLTICVGGAAILTFAATYSVAAIGAVCLGAGYVMAVRR